MTTMYEARFAYLMAEFADGILDEKAMDEALRRCMRLGYATIPEFMIFSGLKRDSAKAYLDSLCKGEHPRLWKVRESRRWLYFPKKNSTTE